MSLRTAGAVASSSSAGVPVIRKRSASGTMSWPVRASAASSDSAYAAPLGATVVSNRHNVPVGLPSAPVPPNRKTWPAAVAVIARPARGPGSATPSTKL